MIAALLLAGASACATPPAAATGDYTEITQGIEAWHEPGEPATIAVVSSAEGCARFEPAKTYPRFGHDGAVWLRFSLAPTGAPHDWRLLARFSELDSVCAYWPTYGGSWREECAGLDHAGSAYSAGWLLQTPPDFESSRPVYLRAASRTLIKVPLTFGTADAILRHDHGWQFGWGLYYGILSMAVLVALLLYVGLRLPATLYYALHQAAFALALAAWQGRLTEWGAPAWSIERLPPLLGALFIGFGARFYQLFLETRQHTPRAHGLLNASALIAIAPAVVNVWEPHLATRLLALCALPWLGAVLAATVVRLRQGLAAAGWVLLAMALLLFSVALKALEVLGFPLVEPDTSTLVARIGALVPPTVLTLAMAVRMRGLMDARDRAARLAATHHGAALFKARFDELTTLPNRQKFRDDLAELLGRPGRPLAVITVGLDRFREINHVLGHDAGDAALQEIAQRLRSTLTSGLLARVGPDVFGVAIELQPPGGATLLEQVADRCWTLQQQVHEPLRIGDGIKLSASFGVSLHPEHGGGADLLLRQSDAALYRAKEVGGGGLEVFRPEILHSASQHLTLARDLRSALDRGELQLHYQPVVDLAGGTLRNVEALLRWIRSDGTTIAPERFIPVAEATDLIEELSEFVLNEACRQLARWRAEGLPVPCVAVNLSPRLVTSARLPRTIQNALAAAGLPGESLEVEITENALLSDLKAARGVLRQLRELRVGIAMDDFGVGYSSLHYLRELPLTTLKIDRSFLRGVPDEPEAATVIAAMIAMGRDLGLDVIAEGIETAPQLGWLTAHGVRWGQGFLYTAARPAPSLARWLQARDRVRRPAA